MEPLQGRRHCWHSFEEDECCRYYIRASATAMSTAQALRSQLFESFCAHWGHKQPLHIQSCCVALRMQHQTIRRRRRRQQQQQKLQRATRRALRKTGFATVLGTLSEALFSNVPRLHASSVVQYHFSVQVLPYLKNFCRSSLGGGRGLAAPWMRVTHFAAFLKWRFSWDIVGNRVRFLRTRFCIQ